jgi:hypothetical protein
MISSRRLACVLSSIVLFGLPLAGCLASPSPTTNDPPAAAQPPCDGAVLHDRSAYTTCGSDGYLAQMEQDSWCCPDGTKPITQTVVSATDTPCSGGTIAAGGDAGTTDGPPACGMKGSGCDKTVCKGNAQCTTKYGGCMCATNIQQNCTIVGNACKDNGCSAAKGAACQVYSNGTDTGCVCAIP